MQRLSLKQSGFSLTEVLLALAILVIGFMLVLGAFPLGMQLTARSTERTIARVAAREAFTKMEMYGIDPNHVSWVTGKYQLYDNGISDPTDDDDKDDKWDFDRINISYEGDPAIELDDSVEKFYPTCDYATKGDQKYYWDAICRRIDPNDVVVHAVVFVSRIINPGNQYSFYDQHPDCTILDKSKMPMNIPRPCRIEVRPVTGFPDWLSVPMGFANAFEEDMTIVDDKTGVMYRILKAFPMNGEYMLSLDRKLDRTWSNNDEYIWFVPTIEGTDRSPCVGVFQSIIRNN